jgi:hypothetical protein
LRYGKAQVVGDEVGRFDARYDRSMKEKMDEWIELSKIMTCIEYILIISKEYDYDMPSTVFSMT